MIPFMNEYTAAIQKDGKLWIGWIEEVPGVNTQGKTRARSAVPRHIEISDILCRKICKDLGGC